MTGRADKVSGTDFGHIGGKKPFSVPSMSPPKSSPRGKFSPLHGIPCFRANLLRLESPAGVPGSPVTVRREHQRSSHVTGLVTSMSPPKSSPRGKFSPLHGIPCFRANLPRLESPAGVPGSPVTVRREHQRSSHVTGLVTVVFSFSLPVLPFRLELGLGASAFVRPIRVGTTFYPF